MPELGRPPLTICVRNATPRLWVSATAGQEPTVELAQVPRIAVCCPSVAEGGQQREANQEQSVTKTESETHEPKGNIMEAKERPCKPKEITELQREQRQLTKGDEREASREWGRIKGEVGEVG